MINVGFISYIIYLNLIIFKKIRKYFLVFVLKSNPHRLSRNLMDLECVNMAPRGYEEEAIINMPYSALDNPFASIFMRNMEQERRVT